jgi:Asp-tRNA(Asn)/Glu-tRNA(Gln) amidotransferase A subunit family amidase
MPSPLQLLRTALASGQTTPATAAKQAAASISRNTYITPLSIESLERAEQLPTLYPNPNTRPPLYGIPISLKDCFDLEGTVTTCGSRFYAQHNPIAQQTSWIAQRLLDCGAVITGKTHLHQLAYGITGENRDYGDCLQPHHPTLLTGGSSSGAAASLQEGSALVAIGTDTGGSVRIPSTLCGLAGYRTSHSLNTEAWWSGGYHLAPSFDTIGILFHDVRDVQFLAHTLFDIPISQTPTYPRIGYLDAPFLHDCTPEVLSAYEATKQLLTQAGATLTPTHPNFFHEAPAIYSPIVASEAAAIHRGHYQHFEPILTERLTAGAAIPASELATYYKRLADFRSQMSTLFETHDFLIAPAAPIHQLRAGADHTESRKAILRYTTPASLTGLPAVTIPGPSVGAPHGTGIQLLAAPNHDATLLAFSSHLNI